MLFMFEVQIENLEYSHGLLYLHLSYVSSLGKAPLSRVTDTLSNGQVLRVESDECGARERRSVKVKIYFGTPTISETSLTILKRFANKCYIQRISHPSDG
jgi:hypothetical protein